MSGSSPAQRPGRTAGFTLVEMLAALAAAAVLVLVMGAMLWYGFLGLTRTKKAVALQRDMRSSMVALSQMTHSATGMGFASGVYTAWYSTGSPAAVYSSSSNLFFDPNTTVAGNEMRLAYGTLKTFSATVSSNSATVVLALGDTRETVSNRVVLFRRN
jgi:prepilin-type N-terminal cleavage/methylation domain-containing protein